MTRLEKMVATLTPEQRELGELPMGYLYCSKHKPEPYKNVIEFNGLAPGECYGRCNGCLVHYTLYYRSRELIRHEGGNDFWKPGTVKVDTTYEDDDTWNHVRGIKNKK